MTSNLQQILQQVEQVAESAANENAQTLEQTLDSLGIYYAHHSSCFYMIDDTGTYIRCTESRVASLLAQAGYSTKANNGSSEVKDILNHICKTRRVDYAGALAGRAPGYVELRSQQRVLVTRSTLPPPAVKGDFTGLREFLEVLLGDAQLPYFYGWLSHMFRMFDLQKFLAGHVLILLGSPGCGKSLLINVLGEGLCTPIGKPLSFFEGTTSFNRDLVEATLLSMDDYALDFRKRALVASAIKESMFSGVHRIHAKGQDAISGSGLYYQRLIIAANTGTEDLDALPQLREGFEDKVHIFRCSQAVPPWVNDPGRDIKSEFASQFSALRWWVENEYEIPEEIRDPRFGVKAYHDPDLIDEVRSSGPEGNLIELIDDVFYHNEPPDEARLSVDYSGRDCYDVSASDLFGFFMDSGRNSLTERARGLARNTRVLGRLLSYAAGALPHRVAKGKIRDGVQLWTIYPATTNEGNNHD